MGVRLGRSGRIIMLFSNRLVPTGPVAVVEVVRPAGSVGPGVAAAGLPPQQPPPPQPGSAAWGCRVQQRWRF